MKRNIIKKGTHTAIKTVLVDNDRIKKPTKKQDEEEKNENGINNMKR